MREIQTLLCTCMIFLCLIATEQIVTYSIKPMMKEISGTIFSYMHSETLLQQKQRNFCQNVPEISMLKGCACEPGSRFLRFTLWRSEL